MAMGTGPVTITCPICGHALAVPAEVVADEARQGTALVRLDYMPLREHLAECGERTAAKRRHPARNASTEVARPAVPTAELAGRIHRMLETRAYIATGGSRACTMCGGKLTECMARTRTTRVGCCAACTSGDTHPAPKGTMSCAEWAAEHGAEQ